MVLSHVLVSFTTFICHSALNLYSPQDINECTEDMTICGFGTCSVTSDGLYQCTCDDGAMATGSNTDRTLTCIGIVYITSLCIDCTI